MTLSKVMLNSSMLSVKLLKLMGMARLLTRLLAVKVTCEDAIAPKSVTSVANDI